MEGFVSSYIKLLAGIRDPAFLIDSSGRVVYWNESANRATGLESGDVEGTQWRQTVLACKGAPDGSEDPVSECPILTCGDKTEIQGATCRIRTSDGSLADVGIRLVPLAGLREEYLHAVILFQIHDKCSKRDVYFEDPDSVALLDPITRVGSKRYLELILQGKFDELRRHGASLAIVWVYIKKHDAISQSMANEELDTLLGEIATGIAKSVRASDVVGRWSKERLMVIISNATEDSLGIISDRFKAILDNTLNRDHWRNLGADIHISLTMANRDDTIKSILDRSLMSS